MNFKEYEKKKILLHIETAKGLRYYSGIVEEVNYLGKNIDGVEIWFLMITDKFGAKVGFNSSQIRLIEEEK